jgi:hypothetical protein
VARDRKDCTKKVVALKPRAACSPVRSRSWVVDPDEIRSTQRSEIPVFLCNAGGPDIWLLTPAAKSLGTTRERAWLDRNAHGVVTYRVGLSANWLDNDEFGDAYVFGRPVTIEVP